MLTVTQQARLVALELRMKREKQAKEEQEKREQNLWTALLLADESFSVVDWNYWKATRTTKMQGDSGLQKQ